MTQLLHSPVIDSTKRWLVCIRITDWYRVYCICRVIYERLDIYRQLTSTIHLKSTKQCAHFNKWSALLATVCSIRQHLMQCANHDVVIRILFEHRHQRQQLQVMLMIIISFREQYVDDDLVSNLFVVVDHQVVIRVAPTTTWRVIIYRLFAAQVSRWQGKDDNDVLRLKWYISEYTTDMPRIDIRLVTQPRHHHWCSNYKCLNSYY
jgi:hypothetical protein